MKSLFAFLILFSFGIVNAQSVIPICAYPSVPAPPLTTIVWDTTTWDYGILEQGPTDEHTFIFTNTGQNPLIIENVKPSCGCTTADWVKEPVKPGEIGWVKTAFNTSQPGHFVKTFTFSANIEKKVQVLIIKGEVLARPVGEPNLFLEPTNR
jgi:Protein of unknown function (DUF1573)